MISHEQAIVQRLVAFIKDHGVSCYTEGLTIFAESVYTLNGDTHAEYVHVPSNMQAVREFLNY